MKAVILCGGLGTRLSEETTMKPKPMVEIGERPILWHIMKMYEAHGIQDFVLALGYKGEVIKDYFRNYHWNMSDVTLKLGRKPQITYHNEHTEEDWSVTLLDTGQETQTGGRLKRALAHVDSDTFLFTYGVGLTNSDINKTIEFHRSHGAIATVTAVKPSGRFGELAMDGQTITGFHEKPEKEAGFVSGGFLTLVLPF
jgi:glucose-1-phosphate cytidylyltransferase